MLKVNLLDPIRSPKTRLFVEKPGLFYVILAFGLLAITLASALASASITPESNNVSKLEKRDILSDKSNKISEEFKVPPQLSKRVSFWFDVYSKYGSYDHLIHHVQYPWIVFEIVNTSEVLGGKGNRWTKYHRSVKMVSDARKKLKQTLLKLSRRKNFKNQSPAEARIVELLKEVPGKRSAVYRNAAKNLRSQLGQKDFILEGLRTSRKYLPYIENVFEERGLPIETTRLPLLESSFNEAAVSKVGASGVWQLMPAIGKKFLVVNNDLDERNSPLKATYAAARLLKENHRILKTWPLALTAYNHGPGGLLKAQKKLKTNDISKIIASYSNSRFGFASSNFYCSFLAVLHVEKYQREIFGEIDSPDAPELRVVELPRSIRVKEILKALSMDTEDFRRFNRDVKLQTVTRNKRIPKGYRLYLPSDLTMKLEAYLAGRSMSVTQKDSKPEEGAAL